MRQSQDARNRDIFITRQAGHSYEDLAKRFELSPNTVRQIVSMERYKRAVSRDGYYQSLRGSDAVL
jgi:Mor family transcriptional regulator